MNEELRFASSIFSPWHIAHTAPLCVCVSARVFAYWAQKRVVRVYVCIVESVALNE